MDFLSSQRSSRNSPHGLSRKYQRNIYSLVKVIFDVAVENRLLRESPIRPKLHRPKLTSKVSCIPTSGRFHHPPTDRKLKLAQKQLRHANIAVTSEVYTHVLDADLERTASILQQALGSPVVGTW